MATPKGWHGHDCTICGGYYGCFCGQPNKVGLICPQCRREFSSEVDLRNTHFPCTGEPAIYQHEN